MVSAVTGAVHVEIQEFQLSTTPLVHVLCECILIKDMVTSCLTFGKEYSMF